MARKIAANTAVERGELLEFIRPRHHAIVIATYPERAKARNARRDPARVSVLFLSDDFGGPWVQVDGTAEVLDVPGFPARLA